ncbi:MAG: ABC transporter permease [Rhodoferax sp.]|jgi:putative ABC transport system permease protein|nr:ABC transporter permease [Rhodoferax sp.]MBP9060255.1 ABC transporter permease [Rhodoferax sp.]
MSTLSLALRNLLRNRRRSLTTLLAMGIGLVAILVFGGYKSNVIYGIETGVVQHSGHLQIQRKGYFSEGGDNPTSYGIANYPRLMDAIKKDPVLAPMLAVVTPSLSLGGLAGNFAAGVTRSVMAQGVVVEEHNRMLAWNEYGMKSYSHPLPLVGTGTDGVVIGTGVARKLKLCDALKVPHCVQSANTPVSEGAAAPDDIADLSALEKGNTPVQDNTRIEMLASTAHGAPNVASLQVVAAENLGIKAIDDVYLAMHLAQAQKLIYGSQDPKVTAIRIQLQHASQIPAAKKRLAQLFEDEFMVQSLEVLDFRTLNPLYGQTAQFMGSMFGFIAILIAVIVLFMIGNTMSTAVVERTVEIGTLRAIGLRRSGIRNLFLCEGVLLGLIGSVFGVLCALGIASLINNSGLSFTPPGYSYAYLILVRIWEDTNLLVGSVVGLIAVTVLSAWWPARRASQLMIVDALRHV